MNSTKAFAAFLLFSLSISFLRADQVTSLADEGEGSLRQVIADAAAGAEISFASGGTITLASPITIDKDIVIDGGNVVTISGGGATNIFKITSGNVVIKNITLKDGLAKGGDGERAGQSNGSQTDSPGGGGAGMGGAIAIWSGSVDVNGVTFIDNKAVGGNGGASPPISTSSNYGGAGGSSVFGGGAARKYWGSGRSNNGGFGGGGSGNNGYNDTATTRAGGNGGFGGGGGGGEASYDLVFPQTKRYPAGNGGVGGMFAGNGSTGGLGNPPGHWSHGYDPAPGTGGGGAGLGGSIFIKAGTLTVENSSFEASEARGGLGGTGAHSNISNGEPGQGVGGAIFVYQDAIFNSWGDVTYSGNTAQTSDANYYIMEGAEYDTAPPVVAGTFTGEVTEGNEGDVSAATGTISITDADADDNPSFEDVQLSGAHGTLVLAGGAWTYTLDQAAAQAFKAGDLRVEKFTLTATDGTQQGITIDVIGANDVPVGVAATAVATEDGDALTGQLVSTDAEETVFVTGTYPVILNDGQELNVFSEYDGENSWLLVGRGREGWEFDADGQGDLADVSNTSTLGTSAAFSPAMYPDAIINEFITSSGADLGDVEIRIKRAANPEGSAYSEMRWRPTSDTVWRSNFDTAMNVELEMVATGGVQGGQIGSAGGKNTRDSGLGGNDGNRIFTWLWANHGKKGFSYGSNVTNGTNNATSFLWENGNENHALPYTELYIRLKDSNRSLLTGILKPGAIKQPDYRLTRGVAGLELNADGSYSFDPSNSTYQSLAEGETRELIAEWIATDEHGAAGASTLTITVTGANDAPVAQAASTAATEDGAGINGQLSVSDTDNNSTFTYALAAPVAGLTLNEDGSYSFDPTDETYQGIASGATRDVVANWIATDNNGATGAGTLTITVTGTNLAVTPATANATEDGALVNGQLVATDDNEATLSYSLNEPVAGLTVNADGSYSFDPGADAYQSLAEGSATDVVANWSVTDPALDETLSGTLTITVSGTNDAPVAVAASAEATAELVQGTTSGGFQSYSLVWRNEETGDMISASIQFPEGAVTNPPTIREFESLHGSILTLTVDGETTVHQDAGVYFHAADELDFSKELVGQAGFDPSQPAGTAGDFNVFGNGIIQGVGHFTVGRADDGTRYKLVSMQPCNAFSLLWRNEETGDTISGSIEFPEGAVTNPPTIREFESLHGSILTLTVDGETTVHQDAGVYFHAADELDFSKELVGQAGFDPSQQAGTAGDFNVFGNGIIQGVGHFTVGRADDGTRYKLVSMQPCPQATEQVQKITGQLVANDVDVNAHLHFSLDAEVAGLTLGEDGAYRFDPSDSAYQFLPTGQTLDVVANWTVKDEHEAADSSILTITVSGSSDAPLTSIAASEDGGVVEGQLENPDAATGYALIEAVAGVSVSADGSYRFDPTVAAYDSLANEEVREIIAVWKANGEDDAEINGVLFITLTGVNDAPSAVAATADATEDGSLLSGQLLAPDADSGAVVGFAPDGAVAGLVINQDGSYSFDPSDASYQELAQGEVQDVVANWIATDDLGATDTGTLTITITGVNDTPAAAAAVASATEGGEAVTGQLVATDVDNGATLAYRLAEAVDGLIVNEDGTYRFDPSNSAYQALAQGETQDVVANWTATDDHDAADAGTLTITVTGSNDDPVASALDGVAAAGQLSATDTDNNSSLSYSLNEPVAGLTINADGSYSFDLSLPAYRSLVAGETMVIEADWTVTDNNEASSTSTIKITLEGINDAPEATAATAAATEDDPAAVTGQLSAADADHNATLTYALDAPVAGLTLNEDGSYSFDLPDADHQALGLGETTEIVANWTATDDQDTAASSTLTITVSGTNDAPVGESASFEVTEGAVASGEKLIFTFWGSDQLQATLILPPDHEWRDEVFFDLRIPINSDNFKFSSENFSPELSEFVENEMRFHGDLHMFGEVSEEMERFGMIEPWDLHRFDLFVFDGDIEMLPMGRREVDIRFRENEEMWEESGFRRGMYSVEEIRVDDSVSSITTGQLTAGDVDANATLSFALDEPVSGLTLNNDGSYSFDAADPAYELLWEGKSEVVVAAWTVTDEHGATGSSELRITVKGVGEKPADSEPPVITLLGESPLRIEATKNGVYTDEGATCEDVIDGTLSHAVEVSGQVVNLRVPGTYEIKYNCEDLSGNPAQEIVRTVIVEDTTVPVIVINGSQSVEVEAGFAYQDEGASATDSLDGEVTVIVDGGNVDTSVLGQQSLSYKAVDAAGNTAVASREVTVVDTLKPVISIAGNAQLQVEASGSGSYTDAGATCQDSFDGNLNAKVEVSGAVVNLAVPGTYEIVYNCKDLSGNAADPVVRTVTVVDTLPPVITLNGEAAVTIEAGLPYTDAGASAIDALDGDVNVSVQSNVEINTVGSYTVIYTASDAAGHSAEVARTVNVIATGGPVITSIVGTGAPKTLSSLDITFTSYRGAVYVLKSSRNLVDWRIVQEVDGQEQSTTVTIDNPVLDKQGGVFYTVSLKKNAE